MLFSFKNVFSQKVNRTNKPMPKYWPQVTIPELQNQFEESIKYFAYLTYRVIQFIHGSIHFNSGVQNFINKPWCMF